MVMELLRHCKAIVGWGSAAELLTAAGCPPDAAGVVITSDAAEIAQPLQQALAQRRAWERMPTAG
jgi:catalase